MSECVIRMVRPVAGLIVHLSIDDRILLLQALLAQEICTFPPNERWDRLGDAMDEMPTVLRATENGMRQALVQNARGNGDV